MKQTTNTQKQHTKRTKQNKTNQIKTKQYGRKINIRYLGKSPNARKLSIILA